MPDCLPDWRLMPGKGTSSLRHSDAPCFSLVFSWSWGPGRWRWVHSRWGSDRSQGIYGLKRDNSDSVCIRAENLESWESRVIPWGTFRSPKPPMGSRVWRQLYTLGVSQTSWRNNSPGFTFSASVSLLSAIYIHTYIKYIHIYTWVYSCIYVRLYNLDISANSNKPKKDLNDDPVWNQHHLSHPWDFADFGQTRSSSDLFQTLNQCQERVSTQTGSRPRGATFPFENQFT